MENIEWATKSLLTRRILCFKKQGCFSCGCAVAMLDCYEHDCFNQFGRVLVGVWKMRTGSMEAWKWNDRVARVLGLLVGVWKMRIRILARYGGGVNRMFENGDLILRNFGQSAPCICKSASCICSCKRAKNYVAFEMKFYRGNYERDAFLSQLREGRWNQSQPLREKQKYLRCIWL